MRNMNEENSQVDVSIHNQVWNTEHRLVHH